jgi:hypothetical protein
MEFGVSSATESVAGVGLGLLDPNKLPDSRAVGSAAIFSAGSWVADFEGSSGFGCSPQADRDSVGFGLNVDLGVDKPFDAPQGDLVGVTLGGFGEAPAEPRPPKPNPPLFAGDLPHVVLGDAPTLGVFGGFVTEPHPKGEEVSALAVSVALSHPEKPKSVLSFGAASESVATPSKVMFASAVESASRVAFVSAAAGVVPELSVVSGRSAGGRILDRGLVSATTGGSVEAMSVVSTAGAGSGFCDSVGTIGPVSSS